MNGLTFFSRPGCVLCGLWREQTPFRHCSDTVHSHGKTCRRLLDNGTGFKLRIWIMRESIPHCWIGVIITVVTSINTLNDITSSQSPKRLPKIVSYTWLKGLHWYRWRHFSRGRLGLYAKLERWTLSACQIRSYYIVSYIIAQYYGKPPRSHWRIPHSDWPDLPPGLLPLQCLQGNHQGQVL